MKNSGGWPHPLGKPFPPVPEILGQATGLQKEVCEFPIVPFCDGTPLDRLVGVGQDFMDARSVQPDGAEAIIHFAAEQTRFLSNRSLGDFVVEPGLCFDEPS